MSSRTPTEGIDYTTRDYEGFRQQMIANLGVTMPEYTDHSQTDAGIVIVELNAKCLDIISFYTDAVANETLLTTCRRRNSANTWCQILSYTPRDATTSRVYVVFKLTGVLEDSYTIPKGTRVKTKKSSNEPEIIFETEADLIIPAGKLGDETDVISGEYLYKVSAIQGVTVTNELVGSSTGAKNQEFPLNYSPVIHSSVNVYVNEGSGWQLWSRVDNFVDSTSISRHFVMKYADDGSSLIVFGDGTTGKIPSPYSNGIYATYRVGGGEQGNVSANTVVLMETNLANVDSVFNPDEVYERGYNRESLEEIKLNAARASEVKWGALSLEDFADVVLLNFPSVLQANAQRDADFVGGDIDSIHVYLLTDTMTTEDTSIDVNLLTAIQDFFDENKGGRKIVGAKDIFIESPNLVFVNFDAVLIVYNHYSRSEVEGKVRALLEELLSLGKYKFNQELSLSEIQSAVMTSGIEGIKSFYFTNPLEQVITPTRRDLFTLGELTIDARGGEP